MINTIEGLIYVTALIAGGGGFLLGLFAGVFFYRWLTRYDS